MALQLKVYTGQLEERMTELLGSGVHVTINSDDPAYFGGYINANYLWLIQKLGLSSQQIADLHANSFSASFLPKETITKHCKALDKAYKDALQAGLWA